MLAGSEGLREARDHLRRLQLGRDRALHGFHARPAPGVSSAMVKITGLKIGTSFAKTGADF